MTRNNQSGQALVLVLLSLSVVLTLVLFILSRSVTDIATSSRSEEATRAFSAAEAGIEKALIIGSNNGQFENGASFTASVTNFADAVTAYNFPLTLSSGESVTTWFVSHDDDGDLVCSADKPCFTGSQLKVCWGKSGTSSSSANTPAVEVIILYRQTPTDPATLRIARVAYDPNATRRASNNFAAPSTNGCSVDGVAYQFHQTISFASLGIPATSYNVQNGLQYAKVRFLYNNDLKHGIAVDSLGQVLPSQGTIISSTGLAGDASRRVEVFQGWPEAPNIFDYAIYSSSGLSK